ncbi:MAG: hypothetical protein KGJ79_18105 [Alphaproteobacteria bacterium]|nr:hypothetical protein [Alphaproteobacteria bacterium]MDE2495171.1 hypothetical protein [Alphaproteobacteria bacterium]
MSENRAPERYFYHSFPRRPQTEGHGHGLTILELIRDFGLLMTPEVARWEYAHADGSPPRRQSMVQRRISFTELAPAELAGHAKDFGPFALEFDLDSLKRLGAIPVFYVPQAGEGHDAGGLGGTLMNHLIDAMRLTDRVAQMEAILSSAPPDRVRQGITIPIDTGPVLFDLDIKEAREILRAISLGLAPARQLAAFLEGGLNYFYPADGRDNAALQYYRQREWRMAGNVAVHNEEMMHVPSAAMIERLLALDVNFFGRPFPPAGEITSNVSLHGAPPQRLADWCWVFQEFDGKRALEWVRRVIVPAEALTAATAILKPLSDAPPVVMLESLVSQAGQ